MSHGSINKLLVFFLLFIFFSQLGCNRKKKKTNRLQKFPTEIWNQDKNGCAGERMKLKNQLLSQKHNMRGFKMDEIESFLGKPDTQELAARSQKYYIYFIEPGPKCSITKEHPMALFVRFSAVGIANEFIVRPL